MVGGFGTSYEENSEAGKSKVLMFLYLLFSIVRDLCAFKQEVEGALIDYGTREYCEWIDSWAQQVVFLVTEILATTELNGRLDRTVSLQEFLNECNEKFELMIELIAQPVDVRKRHVLG